MSLGLVFALALGAASAAPSFAQPLRVLSEFQRLDATGEVRKVDRFEAPRREFISPAVARNGWFTVRVTYRIQPGQTAYLYLAQNPDDTATFKLYREMADGDTLEEVTLPAADTNSGATPLVRSYLVDIFVRSSAPPGRFRAELQLNLKEGWTIYPMEIRVQSFKVPEHPPLTVALAPLSARADATVWSVWKTYLCSGPTSDASQKQTGLTARSLMARNALQDVALMRLREAEQGRMAVVQTLLGVAGFPPDLPPEKACSAPLPPSKRGAEWVLRARDYLVQNLPVFE